MKGALVVFGLLSAALLGLVAKQGKWVELGAALRSQTRSLAPLLALAVLLAACVDVLLSPSQVERWMGSAAGLRGVLVAWLAGALTPGGGPIGLPLAATLARRGAGMPSVLTYLCSLSLLSLLRMPMEWGLLGARLTLTRWGATVLVPPLVGAAALLVERLRG